MIPPPPLATTLSCGCIIANSRGLHSVITIDQFLCQVPYVTRLVIKLVEPYVQFHQTTQFLVAPKSLNITPKLNVRME